MATTTNYGWTTPDDTALVKDGASAIRTLGSSVDTTTKNLNPETTLGDLAYRSSTANVKTRLGLGTAGQILAVNSGATAPEWVAAPTAGGMTLISTTALSGASVTLSSIPTTYTDLRLYIKSFYASAQDYLVGRLNGDSGATSYYTDSADFPNGQVYSEASGRSSFVLVNANNSSANSYLSFFSIEIPQYTDTSGGQLLRGSGYGGTSRRGINFAAVYNNRSAAITSITLIPGAGTMSGGTVYLYGVK